MFQSAAVSPRRMNPQPAEKGVRNSRSVLRLNMSAGQVPVPAREAHASVGAAASELRRHRKRAARRSRASRDSASHERNALAKI